MSEPRLEDDDDAFAAPAPSSVATYVDIKRMSSSYQRRKMALLQRPSFCDWIRAPCECEGFRVTAMVMGEGLPQEGVQDHKKTGDAESVNRTTD